MTGKRIAAVLQVAGLGGVTAAASLWSPAVGVGVGGVSLLLVGLAVEAGERKGR